MIAILGFLKALWSYRRFAPYVAIALLALGVRLEHAKLLASRAETKTISTALHTAEDANRADTAAIAELKVGLAGLQSQLGQARAAGEVAAAKAAQESRESQQRLAASQARLSNLEKDPSYASFLATDLNALYPDLAKWLRDADNAGQDRSH